MARTVTTEGQTVWQPGAAEEDSHFRGGGRYLHLAYNKEEEDHSNNPRCTYRRGAKVVQRARLRPPQAHWRLALSAGGGWVGLTCLAGGGGGVQGFVSGPQQQVSQLLNFAEMWVLEAYIRHRQQQQILGVIGQRYLCGN